MVMVVHVGTPLERNVTSERGLLGAPSVANERRKMKSVLKEDFVRKVPALVEATANTDLPVPGRLLHDIAAWTAERDGLHSEAVLDFLLSALRHGEVCTKAKCLHILRYVVANGHPATKTVLARKDAAIREAADVAGSGAADRKVRDAARELLRSVFDDGTREEGRTVAGTERRSAAPSSGKRMQGGHGSSGGAGKYQGFGTSATPQKTLSEQVTESVARVIDRVTGRSREESAAERSLRDALPAFRAVPVVAAEERNAGKCSKLNPSESRPSRVRARRRGRPGGGWDDEGDEAAEDLAADGGDLAAPGDGVQHCDTEAEVVDRFTDPVLGFPPARKEIVETRERCAVLDRDRVLRLLLSKTTSEAENSQMRALVLLEALMRRGPTDGDYTELISSLREVRDDSSAAVHVKAEKIALVAEKLARRKAEVPT